MAIVNFNYKNYRIIGVDKAGKKKSTTAIEIREITSEGENKVHSIFYDGDHKEATQKAKDWVDAKKEPKEPKKEVEENVFAEPETEQVEEVKE